MRVHLRRQHWQDESDIIGLPVGQRRRRIQNWSNWQDEPSGPWAASSDQLVDVGSIEAGGHEFQYRTKAPLRVLLGDSSDGSNTSAYGLRVAVDPDTAFRVFVSVRNTDAVGWSKSGNRLDWTNLRTASNYMVRARWTGPRATVRLKSGSAPTQWRWLIRYRDDKARLSLDADGIRISSSGGNTIFLPKARAWDVNNGDQGSPAPHWDNPTLLPVTHSIHSNQVVSGWREVVRQVNINTAGATFPVWVS